MKYSYLLTSFLFLVACRVVTVPAPSTPTDSPKATVVQVSTIPIATPAVAMVTPSLESTATPESVITATSTGDLNETTSAQPIPTRRSKTPAPVDLESLVPLTELGTGTYKGFEGGLYPGGSNEMPTNHASVGLTQAQLVQPLDEEGKPDANGKYVLLAIGMSNTAQEFCGTRQNRRACHPWTFIGQAEQDISVNHSNLVIVDGARGGQVADRWASPTAENYDRVDSILAELDVSAAQVQVVWVKVTNLGPRFSLPSERADAYTLTTFMADIARALKVRYPNVRQVFFSSRIYAGYATSALNPEPFAYETGFAVKWLIEAQIKQMETAEGEVDPIVGDLNYHTVAPWIAWGPYLWASGLQPRADGLIWELEDFDTRDFTHPSQLGEAKVADMLLDFFKHSRFTRCWFLVEGQCSDS